MRNGSVYVDGIIVAQSTERGRQASSLDSLDGLQGTRRRRDISAEFRQSGAFDSRYFGPLDVSFVRGRAVHLMTRPRTRFVAICARKLQSITRRIAMVFPHDNRRLVTDHVQTRIRRERPPEQGQSAKS